jgi:plasmid stability protein
MAGMIQIRNVPEEIHRALKVKAAKAGMTLSDFLLREVTHVAARPSVEEVLERIRGRGRRAARIDSAAAVRSERDGRR